MKHAIFYKTYEPDLCWLEWSLKFLERYWHGDFRLVIAAPNFYRERVHDLVPKRLRHDYHFQALEEEYEGYLYQQYVKLMADVWCSADIITYFDSDLMLLRPTGLEDLCENGKPLIYFQSYKELESEGNHVPWQQIVFSVIGRQPQNEYMRVHPFTFHASTIFNLRQRLESLHGQRLYEVIKERPSRSFSEFNLLGYYASLYEQDKYTFKHAQHIFWGRVKQYHSWTQWSPETETELATMI